MKDNNRTRRIIGALNLAVWTPWALDLIYVAVALPAMTFSTWIPIAVPTLVGLAIGVACIYSKRWRVWALVGSVLLFGDLAYNLTTHLSNEIFQTADCALCKYVQIRSIMIKTFVSMHAMHHALEVFWNDIVLPLCIVVTLILAVSAFIPRKTSPPTYSNPA